MRLVELVAAAVLVLGGAAGLRLLWTRLSAPRALPAGPWTAQHRFEDGGRRVYVARGDEREPVGTVDPADPDYDAEFLRLMDRARERAATLNSKG